MKYAITNATSFSTLPLQLVTIMGMISIFFSVVLAIQTLVRYIMGTAVEGFTTVILLILIIGGFLMLSLGIIGHYIARIYEEYYQSCNGKCTGYSGGKLEAGAQGKLEHNQSIAEKRMHYDRY